MYLLLNFLDQCHNLHLHELSECNLPMVTRIPIEYLKYTNIVNRDYLFFKYIALNCLHEDLLDDKFWIERWNILHLQIIFYCKRQKVVPSYDKKLVDHFPFEIKEQMTDCLPQNVSAVKLLDQCHNLHLHELLRMQLAYGDSDQNWISKIHKFC